jgi:quercetin dioxygenase-like cupin family protein
MASPKINIIALSNVYSRLMHFLKKGDVENGHKHTYDHATLVSSGSVLVEVLDEFTKEPISSKTFISPSMVFIHKDKIHRLTALEDNTVCSCIHAIRTIDEEIVDSDFLIEPVWPQEKGEVRSLVQERYKKEMLGFAKG